MIESFFDKGFLCAYTKLNILGSISRLGVPGTIVHPIHNG